MKKLNKQKHHDLRYNDSAFQNNIPFQPQDILVSIGKIYIAFFVKI